MSDEKRFQYVKRMLPLFRAVEKGTLSIRQSPRKLHIGIGPQNPHRCAWPCIFQCKLSVIRGSCFGQTFCIEIVRRCKLVLIVYVSSVTQCDCIVPLDQQNSVTQSASSLFLTMDLQTVEKIRIYLEVCRLMDFNLSDQMQDVSLS